MILEQIQNIVKDYDEQGQELTSNESLYSYSHYGSHCGIRINLGGNILFSARTSSIRSNGELAERKSIQEFSRSSATRMRKYLRTCTATYRTFITLTYPSWLGYSGGKAKRDLKCFLQRYRRLHVCVPHFSAFWFLEFQRSGSIHFHIFGSDFIDRKVLSKIWYEICGSEDSRHLATGTNVQAIRSGRAGICSYAAKYAAKHYQKVVPPEIEWCGRFWGVCGERSTVSADTFVSVHSAQIMSVKKRITSLQNALDDAVYFGKARLLPSTRENICGYILIEPDIMEFVKRTISIINMSVELYNPKCWKEYHPELTGEDLSCL